MRRLNYLMLCVAVLGLFDAEPASAQKPPDCKKPDWCGCNVPPNDPALPLGHPCRGPAVVGECRYDTLVDPKKGDDYQYVCTNKGGGNYEWWYDKAGADKGKKIIGKCDRPQGLNSHGWVFERTNPRQPRYFWQINWASKPVRKCAGGSRAQQPCVEDIHCPGSTCSKGDKIGVAEGNERTWRVFAFKKTKLCKGGVNVARRCTGNEDCPGSTCEEVADNSGFEFKEDRTKPARLGDPYGPWKEILQPRSRRPYESLALSYGNGDSPTPSEEAWYSVRLALVGTGAGGDAIDVRWSAFEGADPPLPRPILKAGDSVYLDDLSMTDVIDHDPRFTLSAFPPGVKLIATEPVLINTGDVAATVRRPAAEAFYYAVLVEGAEEFLDTVLNGAPIELELQDIPGYAGTWGTLHMFQPAIPTVSEWGLTVLTLIGLAAGTILLRRGMLRSHEAT